MLDVDSSVTTDICNCGNDVATIWHACVPNPIPLQFGTRVRQILFLANLDSSLLTFFSILLCIVALSNSLATCATIWYTRVPNLIPLLNSTTSTLFPFLCLRLEKGTTLYFSLFPLAQILL
jgi:hypothetical protein